MRIQQVAGALGAEISGLDLSRGLSAAQAQDVRAAFLTHQVIFFRDQPLSPEAFMAFAEAMGEPVEYPFVKGVAGFPKIIEVKKLETERVNFGGIWHSDTTYLQEPPMGSMLLAREVPPFGGDTLFASQYAAYEALSPEMKRILDPLVGVSSSAKADVSKTREDRLRSDGKDEAPKDYLAHHPVVRTHPETGEKILYACGFSTHFVNFHNEKNVRFGQDKTPGASLLLNYLCSQAAVPEYQVRFTWEPGSVAFWDNRCTQHYAVQDYWPAPRKMERAAIMGNKPF